MSHTSNKGVAGGLATLDTAGKLPAAQAPAAPTFTGDTTVTGNLILNTAAKGIKIKEGGAAAKMGTGTLNGATEVTIATTAVTATSRIFLTVQTPHGTPAWALGVSARSNGVSFGVKGVASDTSDFAWIIVEPSP